MMMCPRCKAEYRDGFHHCAECFVNLVVADRPAGEPDRRHDAPPEDVTLVQVFESRNPALVLLAKSLLESAKIEFATRGEGLHEELGWGVFPGSLIGGPVIFEVRQADAADAVALLADLKASSTGPDEETFDLIDFGTRYAEAWSSRDPDRLAAFYEEDGCLQVNDAAPAVGREAVRATAAAFMTAFPDMAVTMDNVSRTGSTARFDWTWTGTNTGPGGTGKSVRMTGYEEWTLDADGLIVESLGHFDQAEYERQLSGNRA